MTTATGQSNRAKTNAQVKGLGKFLFRFTITFIGLLNIQPWVAIAKQMKSAITFVPFLSALIKIPFLGGCLLWLSNNEIALSSIATGLWGLTQYCEMTDTPWIRKRRPLVYMWEFAVIFLHFPPYEGGYIALLEDLPYPSFDQVSIPNILFSIICAFAFEFLYNILKK
jgi:hypothetical protein